jgi:hypothetical protein
VQAGISFTTRTVELYLLKSRRLMLLVSARTATGADLQLAKAYFHESPSLMTYHLLFPALKPSAESSSTLVQEKLGFQGGEDVNCGLLAHDAVFRRFKSCFREPLS